MKEETRADPSSTEAPLEEVISDLRNKLTSAESKLAQYTGIDQEIQRHIFMRIIEKTYGIIIGLIVPFSIGLFNEALTWSSKNIQIAIIFISISILLFVIVIVVVIVWLNNKRWRDAKKIERTKNVKFYTEMNNLLTKTRYDTDEIITRMLREHQFQIQESYEFLSQSIAAFSEHFNQYMLKFEEQGNFHSNIPEADPIEELIEDFKEPPSPRYFIPQQYLNRKKVEKELPEGLEKLL